MPVCFWEDLVNVEQGECGPSGEGLLAYATESPGNCGGTLGRFVLSAGNANVDLAAALVIAAEVTITGVYQDDIAQGDFAFSLGDEVAGYVVFEDVDYPLTFSGFYDDWVTDEIPELDATFGQWFRVDVDGTIFYGATPLTTSC